MLSDPRAEVAEGVNIKIMPIERRVGGYRNLENFRTTIFFHCGGYAPHPTWLDLLGLLGSAGLTEGHTEAHDVVSVLRRVPATERRPREPRGVVPAAAP